MKNNSDKSSQVSKVRNVLLMLAQRVDDNTLSAVITGKDKFMFICDDTAIVIGKIVQQ